MCEIIQLNRINSCEIDCRKVRGIRGYNMWLITGRDREQVQRAANAVIGARGIKYSSMSVPRYIEGAGYVVTGYTVDNILATIKKEH